MIDRHLSIIGGGLAGCEAAWQAASRGRIVDLYEMRPARPTPAHMTDFLAELVCSNSMRSEKDTTAVGTLKNELRRLDSLILKTAEACRVPAGNALAVDRRQFAEAVTKAIASHPAITLKRQEVTKMPGGEVIVATGPLTSEALAEELKQIVGEDHLSFYDGIAPIVEYESLTEGTFFLADRYQDETEDSGQTSDYLNIPLNEAQYRELVSDLVTAEISAHLPEEDPSFFDGCLPIEEMARRGTDTPRFGPLKPVGLTDPGTGRRPYAVIQLRKEDLSGSLYNLVGFQTQMTIPEQKRILRKIPAFTDAVFVRWGSAHRNTFMNSPLALNTDLTVRARPHLRIAGQISGVEGYVESTSCGLIAGLLASINNLALPPSTTVIGGLIKHITGTSSKGFQPMKANWGLVSHEGAPRRNRKEFFSERSRTDLETWIFACKELSESLSSHRPGLPSLTSPPAIPIAAS